MTSKVLIIGGGIAGTVAAVALHEVGITAEVYEAYPRSADGVGAFLTLAVNGLAALDSVGLAETVGALGMDTPAMRLLSGRTGRVLGGAPMRARTVARGDLYTALRAETERRGIPVRYGRRLVDLTESSTGVRAVFDDGTSTDADLLVGADGIHSATRTLIDPAAPRAEYLGLLNTGGYARGVRVPGDPGVARFLFGRRCFFGWLVHPDRDGEVWWFANPPMRREPDPADLAAITPDAWRTRLERLFARDVGPMSEIIAATEHIFPPWGTYDLRTVPRWHRERAVIIGDAAHTTSPSSGQGASMAIEDAVTLARCLRDIPDPAAALATYTQLRRDRVERVVRQGRRNGSGKAAGRVGAIVRDATLPFVLRRFATPESQAWMFDHRIDFGSVVDVGPVGQTDRP